MDIEAMKGGYNMNEMDDVLKTLGKHYNQKAQTYFWAALDEDSYMRTQADMRQEAGLSPTEFRKLMADARFLEMLDVASDAMMYASLAQVRNARLAFAKEFSGVSDRKAFLDKYDADEEVDDSGSGITIINNLGPATDDVQPDVAND
jgi:hypothetical protein